MDEAEWLAGGRPLTMLEAVKAKVSSRKHWLFTAAAFRLLSGYLPQEVWRVGTLLSERLADGLASIAERQGARELFMGWKIRWVEGQNFEFAAWFRDFQDVLARPPRAGLPAAALAELQESLARAGERGGRAARSLLSLPLLTDLYVWDEGGAARVLSDAERAVEAEACNQSLCSAIQDFFGNPFYPAVLKPTCRTPTVLSLAQAAYDARLPDGRLDNDRLAVLSDALVDAGCDDALLLEHLRGERPFYRGMWSLDIVLGKR